MFKPKGLLGFVDATVAGLIGHYSADPFHHTLLSMCEEIFVSPRVRVPLYSGFRVWGGVLQKEPLTAEREALRFPQ